MRRILVFLVCFPLLTIISFGQEKQADELLSKAIYQEEVKGDLEEAILIYTDIIKKYPEQRAITAEALFHLGLSNEKLGNKKAQEYYETIVNSFGDQPKYVRIAKERLSKLLIADKDLEIPLEPKFIKIKMPTNPGNGVISPDGKRLAFIYDGSVWTIPVSGGIDQNIAGEPKKITDNINAWDMSNSFAWSGDGKWIAVNAESNEEESPDMLIYVVSSEGGKPQKVQVPSHVCGWPEEFRLSLSADGKTLAYTTGHKPGDWQNKLTQIFTIAVNGGEAKELTGQGTQEPAFSPDGSKIAYVKCNKDNNVRYYYSNIWVIPSKGGTPIKVSNFQTGQAFGPVWSRDGKMIAFLKRPEGGNAKEIWIVPLTKEGIPSATAKKIDLPLESSFYAFAGWTPDNRIGLQLRNPAYEIIYTVNSKGGIATQVTQQGWNKSYPKWSPDGKKIFFRNDRGMIAYVPAEGGAINTIPVQSEFQIGTAAPGSGNDVSPDGKTIVFSGGKTFFEDGVRKWDVTIYTIPVEGGSPTQLTEVAAELQDRFPCWSPDGNTIAFIRSEIKNGNHIMYIYKISKDGKKLKQISTEADNILWAPIDWSPDGKNITFFTKSNTIHSIPAKGGESVFITRVESVNSQFDLAWSPNGKELAYTDQGKIWIYSPKTGITREVKTGVKASATKIGWSPDGNKIAFTALAGGDNELWVMEDFLPLDKLAQKKEKEKEDIIIHKVIDGTGAGFVHGNPSPDGKYFAFVDWLSSPNDIVIKEIGTGKEIRLKNQTDLNFEGDTGTPYSPIWSPDSKKIVYTWHIDNDEHVELRVVEIDNPAPDVLVRVSLRERNGWVQAEDWTPDGQHILVGLIDNSPVQMGLISIEDGSFTLLKKFDDSNPSSAKFSPDGHYVAYDLPQNKEDNNHDIYVISLEGKQEAKLTFHPSHDYLLDWTPSGEEILFASDRTGTTDMWSISFDKETYHETLHEKPKSITKNIGLIKPLGSARNGSLYFSTPGSWWDIFTVTVDPTTGKITEPSTEVSLPYQGYNRHPVWSPDGKYLAYVSDLRELRRPNILCIYSKETGSSKEFAHQKDVNFFPCWFPDGKSILVNFTDVLNIATGEITPFIQLKNEEQVYSARISSDNKYIYYAVRDKDCKMHSIIRRDLESGEEKELYLLLMLTLQYHFHLVESIWR